MKPAKPSPMKKSRCFASGYTERSRNGTTQSNPKSDNPECEVIFARSLSVRPGDLNVLKNANLVLASVLASPRASWEQLKYPPVVFAVVEVFRVTGANLRFGILWYPPALALCW